MIRRLARRFTRNPPTMCKLRERRQTAPGGGREGERV